MEKDDEVKGGGNSYDFGARMYDARVGRWLSCDKLESKYPSLSSYNFAGNLPTILVDKNGKVIWDPIEKKEVIFNSETNKFSYKDGSDLTEKYKEQAFITLNSLASSRAGQNLINKITEHETKFIIDETKIEYLNSNNNNKPPNAINEGKNYNEETGLFDEVLIIPNIKQIQSKSDENVGFDERILGTMTVEFEHNNKPEQILFESENDLYINSKNFGKAYNKLMNESIGNMINYRNEKGIEINKSVFLMYESFKNAENGNGKPIGSEIKLNNENQKVYDTLPEK